MILKPEKTYGVYLIIEIEGRIDGLTSSALNKKFEQLTEEGNHKLVVDFSAVSYISSAGLRVFLKTQKKLRTVGGEIILLSMQETARDVFKVSGLENIFRIIETLKELGDATHSTDTGSSGAAQFVSDDHIFRWELKDVPDGNYSGIGNSSKLRLSAYTQNDIVTISQSELQFGVGLACIGESLLDYSSLFGESLLVNHHYFGYPAIEQPAVDYAFYSETHPGPVHFLYGFRFGGDYKVRFRFDSVSPIDLLSLARKSAEICGKDFFGLVMVGKSAGIYGLGLSKIPWQENAPEQGDIMNESNFPSWFDFPVEDTDLNKTVIAAGIYSKSGSEEELHMHGVVYSKGLISRTGMELNKEIDRILHGGEPLKVVHLLEECRFYNGLAGIVTF